MNFKTDINYRKQILKKLLNVIVASEKKIANAIYDDFKKSEFEVYVTETNIVISELKLAIKCVNNWAKPKKVFPALSNFPSSERSEERRVGKECSS